MTEYVMAPLDPRFNPLDVEDLYVEMSGDRFVPPEVYGHPMHQTVDELIAASGDLANFLKSEARHSVGNYVVVVPAPFPLGARLITSPGYCGGYIYSDGERTVVSTTLYGLLQNLELMMDEMALCHFLNHAPKSTFNQYPFSALFKNVVRLPPAAVVELQGGEVVKAHSYMPAYAKRSRPKSFAAAIDETTAAFASYFKRTGQNPTLMFSGGVDSLAIYLSLRQMMDPKDIRCIVMQHNKANGPERATPIARHLGMSLEVWDVDLDTPSTVAGITEMAKNDIIATASPHLAFIDRSVGGHVLHGQNMDALANVNMTVLQANKEVGLLSVDKVRAELTEAQAAKQSETFIANLPFTADYLKDKNYQKLTQHYYQSLHKGSTRDPDPGEAGVLRGMISSSHPNLLLKASYPLRQIDILNREVERAMPVIAHYKRTRHELVDHLRYYGYAQIANKRMASMSLPGGEQMSLAAMSGPIISYFLGRPRSLLDATRPKREIYGYAKTHGGAPYSEMAAFQKGDVRHVDAESRPDAYLAANRHLLDEARVLDRLDSGPVRSHVAKIYAEARAAAGDTLSGSGRYSRSRARQLVNLELILSGA